VGHEPKTNSRTTGPAPAAAAAVSIRADHVLSTAAWRRLEHKAVTRHEAGMLAQLKGLAAQHTAILSLHLAEDGSGAALEFPGYQLLLGGLSSTASAALEDAIRRPTELALGGVGRYGQWWWLRLVPQAVPVPLIAAHLRLVTRSSD
jgi:hypothetical protein